MKTLLSIITLNLHIIYGSGIILAQAPQIEWQKTYGGSGYDSASAVQQTADGGYIVAGTSESNDGDVSGNHLGNDYWITKLNATGNIQWQKSYGGSGQETAQAVQQTVDGGYIIAGNSNSTNGEVTGNHGGFDYWIVKVNSTGDIEWQRSLGGSGIDIARSIKQTADGGYIVSGNSNSTDGDVTGNHGSHDFWVVRLNEEGNILWQKSYGGSGEETAFSIKLTEDGGFVVAGHATSTDGDVTGNQGFHDYWVVRLNESGNILWQKSLGGTSVDVAHSVQQTAEGGFIVAGQSISNDGDVTGNHGNSTDFWIVKLDMDGNLEWQKSLGGTELDNAQSIQQIADGGYIVAGFSESNDGDVTENQGDNDYWVIKLGATGNIQWQQSLGGSERDNARDILRTIDGGYIIAGGSLSNDGDVTGNHGDYDFWIVKLEFDPLGIEEFKSQINVFPNPVATVLNISTQEPINTVSIFNQLGQKVMASSHSTADLQLAVSGLPANLYLVVVETDKSVEAFKIIVQ